MKISGESNSLRQYEMFINSVISAIPYHSIDLLILIADFMRPVVILGPVADLVRMLLVDEMPDRFASPSKAFFIQLFFL